MFPKFKNAGTDTLLAVLSGVLFFLSFPAFNYYLLEWLAFLPLLFALEQRTLRQSYLLGLVTGIVAIYGGFIWVADWAEIVLGFLFPLDHLVSLVYAFCIGQMFGIIAILYQWIRQQSFLDELLVFPTIVTAVFSVFPMIFYFKLGDAQSYFLPAIQAIEYTGVYGLDFMIALVNIMIYKLVQYPRVKTNIARWGVCIIGLVVWFGFGIYALQEWDEKIDNWQSKKIGLVQPNRPAQLSRPNPEKGYSRQYPLEMEMSEKLVDEGALAVFWPEGHFYGYVFWSKVRESFTQLVSQMGVPIVFHDATYENIQGKKHFYNSAIWINQQGKTGDMYHKMDLVPFGEYTPLLGWLPFIQDLLGDYLSDLSSGKENKTFLMAGMKIVPKICYEPLFPTAVAESIRNEPRGKVLLVQSQDGWYGESSEPEQHMTVTALRAVENRVPLIHVINNGASAVVLPNGRYKFRSPPFVRGAWVAEIPYNSESGGSFFSRFPYAFIGLIWAMVFILVLTRMNSMLLIHNLTYRFKKKEK